MMRCTTTNSLYASEGGDSQPLGRFRWAVGDSEIMIPCAPLHLAAGSVGEFCYLPADLHEMRMHDQNVRMNVQRVNLGLPWWGMRGMQAPRTFPSWLRDGVMLGGRSFAAKPKQPYRPALETGLLLRPTCAGACCDGIGRDFP
jgi:hypothetical protein